MNNLEFKITVNAPAKKLWQVLWNDDMYRKWTSAFHEGSYAVSDWQQGSKVHFLSPDGNGMYSIISECRENEQMSFKHLGIIKSFEEQPASEETNSWGNAIEEYSLTESNGRTTLTVTMNTPDSFAEYLNKTFPVALQLVKELAEKPVTLTIEATALAPPEKVWEYWTSPEHITQWNNASDDWFTPAARNDLRKGGSFTFTMAAKDGSVSFDFAGIYDEVKTKKSIAYTLLDGRRVKIDFSSDGQQTNIVESFEAEEMNSLDLQKGGWQSILNNFKKHIETN